MSGLRFAFRQLRKNPGFTAVAVLTLALGIGVNTAMFSVVNGVVLRRLPYPDADRLVEINQSHRIDPALANYLVSGLSFKHWKAQTRSFEGMTAFQWPSFAMTGGDEPIRVNGAYILADFLPIIGVKPFLGRAFIPEDEISGGVVMLAHDLWRQRFGADAAVLGKAVTLDAKVYTVIGVLPPGFRYPVRAQVWIPLSSDNEFLRESCESHVVARRGSPKGVRRSRGVGRKQHTDARPGSH